MYNVDTSDVQAPVLDATDYGLIREIAFEQLWLYLGTLLDCAEEDPEGTVEWAERLRLSGQQATDDMPDAPQEVLEIGQALVNALANFLQGAARAVISDRESEESAERPQG